MAHSELRLSSLFCAALPILIAGCGSKASAPVSAAGSWTGTISSPGTTPVGIRFALQEENGKLTGQTYVEDPETRRLLPDADLTGSRQASDATWTTSTGIVVQGRFEGSDFVGTLEFPAEDSLAIQRVDLALKR